MNLTVVVPILGFEEYDFLEEGGVKRARES